MHKREQGKENDKQKIARGKERKSRIPEEKKEGETTELRKIRMQRKGRISREDKWIENLYFFKSRNAASLNKKFNLMSIHGRVISS